MDRVGPDALKGPTGNVISLAGWMLIGQRREVTTGFFFWRVVWARCRGRDLLSPPLYGSLSKLDADAAATATSEISSRE